MLLSVKNGVSNDEIEMMLAEIKQEISLDNLVSKDYPDKINFERFNTEIVKRGAIINNVKTRWQNKNLRYGVTTTDIKKGEDLIAIPHSEWITLEQVVIDSPLCEKLNQFASLTEKLSFPWRNSFFAVFLIEQKKLKDQSKYSYYIDSMPTDLSNYPVMFGEKEREMLKNSCILEKIDIKVATWKQDYHLLCSAEPTLNEQVSFNEF